MEEENREDEERCDSRNPDLPIRPLREKPELYDLRVRDRNFVLHGETRSERERGRRKRVRA